LIGVIDVLQTPAEPADNGSEFDFDLPPTGLFSDECPPQRAAFRVLLGVDQTLGEAMAKQSSPKLSTLASKILSGEKKPTITDAKRLAVSVLSQDETKSQKPKKTK